MQFNGFQKIKRVGQILKILSKHGFDEIISRSNIDRLLPDSFLFWNNHAKKIFEDDFNTRIRMAIEELGPTFVKLGQLLSNRPDIIPKDLQEELVKLQDDVMQSPIDLRAVLASELEIDLDAHFSEINVVPIASASIAQVYKAKLINGQDVALKVKRAGIDEVIRADLDFIKDLVQLLQRKYEVIYKMNLYQIVLSFESSLLNELSFTNELNNIERFRRNFALNNDVYVPKVHRQYSTDRVLCLEFIEGVKVNDLEGFKRYGLYTKSVLQNVLDLYLEQVLMHGFFHADPHPGNVLVNKRGQVVFLDFGAMGFMIAQDRNIIEAMVLDFLANDAKSLIKNIKKLAVVHHIEDERRLERDAYEIFEMIKQNALDDIDISVMLQKLNIVLQSNHILLPDFVYILLRGVSILEGTGRQLDAELNVPESIEPFAKKIAQEKLSAEYLIQQLKEKAKFAKDVLTEVPVDLLELLEKVKNDKVTLNHKMQDFDNLQLILHRMGNKFLLSILAMTFGVGASIMAHGRVGYLVWGIPVLSWFGFIASFIICFALLNHLYKSK
ncbi:AarF/ABC1/UbiB kinase family protein [Sphingobacterium sp. DK4209]|uniref:AarF/ABC1/UbiB kinase family protein n=1 Tax=Sphingobacterium zhuxiongii TaxID=2662364 RepID=A0A5Q0Q8I3_9SPHI|nr:MULTISPECIES: AarF/UbiB family protein [unclassified Sphingobacterium]MVZ65276.1 AarF/ABC1/UbiB kinase family protein [Sphingobacterium sp. DK4209]QGA26367.1 AarF/ABC1/UbiB kinase family protein [Sphingobacterium sp. dk4302]